MKAGLPGRPTIRGCPGPELARGDLSTDCGGSLDLLVVREIAVELGFDDRAKMVLAYDLVVVDDEVIHFPNLGLALTG